MRIKNKLPLITEINTNLFHDLSVEILKNYNFSNESNIAELTDLYSDKYIEVYNHLVKKYHGEEAL